MCLTFNKIREMLLLKVIAFQDIACIHWQLCKRNKSPERQLSFDIRHITYISGIDRRSKLEIGYWWRKLLVVRCFRLLFHKLLFGFGNSCSMLRRAPVSITISIYYFYRLCSGRSTVTVPKFLHYELSVWVSQGYIK